MLSSAASSFDLVAAARSEMIREGFHLNDAPGPDADARLAQLVAIREAAAHAEPVGRDLRALLWSSIDNDSRGISTRSSGPSAAGMGTTASAF